MATVGASLYPTPPNLLPQLLQVPFLFGAHFIETQNGLSWKGP